MRRGLTAAGAIPPKASPRSGTLDEVIYFDASFLFRLYWKDPGWESITQAAETADAVGCAEHGRVEVVAAAHRKFREGVATSDQLAGLVQQFRADCAEGGIRWLPLTQTASERAEAAFLAAPADVYLRAADALHLACAAEHGFDDIHSNDRHLLAAASLFGLRGVNLIDS